MASRCLIWAVVAMAGIIALAGCAGTVDLKDITKDYTFHASLGPLEVPAHFYDNDSSLKPWYSAPYFNPYMSN